MDNYSVSKSYLMKFTLGLIFIAISQFHEIANAQSNDTLKNKGHLIYLGITQKDGKNNFGGIIKYEFVKNDKIGFGLKSMLTKNQFDDYFATNYYIKKQPGIYFIFEGTLTKYILGNINKSKAAIYVELGIGYHLDKQATIIKYNNFPSFNEKYQSQGLGSTLAIGSRLKIGRGSLFAEAMLGGILIGSFYNRYIFPEGYPGLASGNPFPNNGPNNGSNLKAGGQFLFINDGILSINLGYRFNL